MNKTMLNVIQLALRQRSHQVRANKTWQTLHDEYAIGGKCADGFLLSDDDLAYLQALYDKHVKSSITTDSETTHRLHTAQYYRNEKLADMGVFSDLLNFAAPVAHLPLQAGQIWGGVRGLVLSVGMDELCTDEIDKLIIIENGTLITQWHLWHHLLPGDWQLALLLYRGHGANVRHVTDLLDRLPKSAQVAIYADFDVAGLDIVANFAKDRAISIILPKAWQSFDETHQDNQPLLFVQQNSCARQYASPILVTIYQHLCRHRLALTQEHVLSLGELVVVELSMY